MAMINETHDPLSRSWVDAANTQSDFPIQNLPHGVFSRTGEERRGGVAIGDQILDMQEAVEAGLFEGDLREAAEAAAEPALNRLMSLPRADISSLRRRLFHILKDGSSDRDSALKCLVPMQEACMHVPAEIGGFTDFCTSVFHVSADRPGRPGRPLHPAFKHLPIGYNSRASSIVVDGEPVERPNGQGVEETGETYFGPSRDMDFELEFGIFVGQGNSLGRSVNIDEVPDRIFGYAIVNDWSARDIQRFESMLGPFLSKNHRTSISPWIVTEEAMRPFRTAPMPRTGDDPPTKPHLTSPRHDVEGSLSIRLQAFIQTDAMRARAIPPHRITDTDFRHCYWTLDQIFAHHASNGCNLQPADLLASGTISGPEFASAACFWELTGGSEPITLPGGEQRLWLEDGDEIVLSAHCYSHGFVPIGFGTCSGRLTSAAPWPSAPAQ